MENDKDTAAFIEFVAKRLQEDPRSALSGRHRAAFAAVRHLVAGALASGYTMKFTWEALRAEKKLSMSYETFRTHCRRADLAPGMPDANQPTRGGK